MNLQIAKDDANGLREDRNLLIVAVWRIIVLLGPLCYPREWLANDMN
jgi:hypothetical protein